VDLEIPAGRLGARNNHSITGHLFLWESSKGSADKLPSGAPLASESFPMTLHMPVRHREHKLLLTGSNATDSAGESWPEGDVPHLRPRLGIHIVKASSGFPRSRFPPEMQRAVVQRGQRLAYRPIVWVDDLSILHKDFTPLSSNSSMPDPTIPLEVKPINLGFYRLLRRFAESMNQMKSMGMTEKDLEQVKELFAGTRWQWLLATFVVSILHSFFSFLAFKNDVGFWRGRTNMEGLSARSFMANFACQVIIFLHLLEGRQTSIIILAEVAIGVAIEAWKVSKIMAARGMANLGYWRGGQKPADNRSKRDLETDEYDAYATRMLSYVMYPLVALYGLYCLVYLPQRSWLGWLLATLSSGVYMFGFITMTPQLYINYKLKSVAHLPWRAFMYKAFNTFIDDVFAFAIAMPMTHRLACLRDDIVFFIYLYQRYLYPIDKTRVNEFGIAYEELREDEQKAPEQKKQD